MPLFLRRDAAFAAATSCAFCEEEPLEAEADCLEAGAADLAEVPLVPVLRDAEELLRVLSDALLVPAAVLLVGAAALLLVPVAGLLAVDDPRETLSALLLLPETAAVLDELLLLLAVSLPVSEALLFRPDVLRPPSEAALLLVSAVPADDRVRWLYAPARETLDSELPLTHLACVRLSSDISSSSSACLRLECLSLKEAGSTNSCVSSIKREPLRRE